MLSNMKNFDVFVFFLSIRFVSIAVVQTWFVPDEYWQSLEVAHNFAFGYGYLSWEWILGIRSYLHPSIIALIYKMLQLSGCDNIINLIYIPRILQAVLSAYSDLCFYRWCGGKKWAAFSISTAWFWFYTGSRTIINSFETALTVIALYNFPWQSKVKDHKFLWIVAFLCLVRPTAAIQWYPLCVHYILISEEKFLAVIIKRFLPIGLIALIASVTLDSFARGSFTITSYQFLKANVFDSVGEWYGSQPWYWYLSTGFPAILGIQFVPFILATIHVLRYRYVYKHELALLGCIVFTLIIYSLFGHKEFRFILPLLPIALNISSEYLSIWSRKANSILLWLVAGVLLVGNVIPAVYLSTIHQRGTLDVMVPLRKIAEKNPHNTSLLFLMPCHSTPLYSHLHVNVTAKFLTCEPNLMNRKSYIDEADEFYGNPNNWLRKNYPLNRPLPSHIIMFDNLAPLTTDILSRYKPTHQIFHTNFPNGRVGQYITIYEKIVVH